MAEATIKGVPFERVPQDGSRESLLAVGVDFELRCVEIAGGGLVGWDEIAIVDLPRITRWWLHGQHEEPER